MIKKDMSSMSRHNLLRWIITSSTLNNKLTATRRKFTSFTASFAKDTNSSPIQTAATVVPQNQKPYDYRCVLFGFARNSSRVDLEMVLGENKPQKVDPYLNRKDLMFSGLYRLHFQSAEEIGRLNAFLRKKFDKKYYVIQEKEMNGQTIPASVLHITRRSILVTGLTGNVVPDNIYGWLAGYQLAPSEFVDVESGEKRQTYSIHIMSDRENERGKNVLIHCASSAEARRLVSNKTFNPDSKYFGLHYGRIIHYQA